MSSDNKLGTLVLSIENLSCASCTIPIDAMLEAIDGVVESNTDYAKQKIVISYNRGEVSSHKLIASLLSLGYKTKEFR
jgi:P-type Cu+ transporter